MKKLKKVMASKYAKDENLQSMILDLKNKFISGCICIFVVLFAYPFAVTDSHSVELIGYLTTATTSFYITNLIITIKLSFKAYLFFLKIKGSATLNYYL